MSDGVGDRPNVLVVMSDQQRWDLTRERIFAPARLRADAGLHSDWNVCDHLSGVRYQCHRPGMRRT